MIYGYARVSTDEQSVDAQVKQLRGAGAQKIFRETASGARTDRAGLRQVLGRLGKGDVLMVTRLDRLARSTRDLLNTLAAIAVREAGSGPLATHGPTPQPWLWCKRWRSSQLGAWKSPSITQRAPHSKSRERFCI